MLLETDPYLSYRYDFLKSMRAMQKAFIRELKADNRSFLVSQVEYLVHVVELEMADLENEARQKMKANT